MLSFHRFAPPVVLVALAAWPAAAKEAAKAPEPIPPQDIAGMVRGSEAVIVATATKVDETTTPPRIDVKLETALKGALPAGTRIAALPDDSGGDNPGDPWKTGTKYLIFITQVESKVAFTYQNLKGKINAPPALMDGYVQIVRAVKDLDASEEKAARTAALKKALGGHAMVRGLAFNEILTRGMNYDLPGLEGTVVAALKDKDAKIRAHAIDALARIKDSGAKGGIERDVKFVEQLVPYLSDNDEEVRGAANRQLMRRARNGITFEPGGAAAERAESVKKWQEWVAEQKADKDPLDVP